MAPLLGGVAIVAGAIIVAVLVGAAGGAINGRLKGELSLGAILVVGTYFLVVISLESWSSWKVTLFGMLPLILSFLVGSLTTQFLETRFGLRPVFATLAALGSALLVGFLYLTLIRFGWWVLVDPSTAWIALAALSYLTILSIQRKVRAAK